jgi:cytochrome c
MTVRGNWLCLVTLLYVTMATAAGDANRGSHAFHQCTMCHSVEPGRQLTGPSLAHVFGRKAGAEEGFNRYSLALQKSGVVWNDKTLDRWLTNPAAFIPGNYMAFAGIRDASTRSDIIAYLEAVSEGKAPAVESRGGGMMGDGTMDGGMGSMMGRGGPPNLKQADAGSQVVSLHHCHDSYIAKTANGKTRKVWEFNLRLKTDSSSDGPAPGKPVMTAAGMQGDRFDIIFASPKELGTFIKETCE